jgi:hypothetical protein
MRLSGTIHRAEQQGMDSLHRGAERARSGAKQLGSRVRQGLHAVAQHLPMSFHGEEHEEPKPQVRQGIVSINGQDVGTVSCTGGKKTA